MALHCEWQGKLLSVDKDSETVLLQALREEDGHWEIRSTASIHIERGLVYHSLEVVFDSAQGLHKPYLLAHDNATHKILLFECQISDNLLVTRYTFDWAVNSKCKDIKVFNGPLLVISALSSPILTVVDYASESQTHNIDMSNLLNKPVAAVEKCWAFTLDSDHLLVLVKSSSQDEGRVYWANFTLCCGVVSESKEVVPYEYGCIASCIECQEHVRMSSVTGELTSHKRFFVGTSYKQVVVFEEGVLLYCVTVNRTPLREIVVLESSEDRVSFAVGGTDSVCMAYKLIDSSLQEYGCWRDVAAMVSGFFTNADIQQLLILKCRGDGKEKQELLVTDLTEKPALECSVKESNNNSLSDTVRAFQLKRHDGEVQLTELESEVQRKAVLIQSCLNLMTSLVIPQGPGLPSSEQDLLCLVPGAESCLSENTQPLSLVKVERTWTRIERDLFAVAMVLTNVSTQDLSEMCFSLLLPVTTPTDTTSHVLWHSALCALTPQDEAFLNQFPSKRRRLEKSLCKAPRAVEFNCLAVGESLCVVITAPLSCWDHQQLLPVTILLKGRRETVVWTENVSVSLTLDQALSDKLRVQKSCLRLWKGEDTLSDASINWGDRGMQDLATLLALMRVFKVKVDTGLMSQTELADIVSRRLPLIELEPLTLVSMDTGSPLDTVAVCICPDSRHLSILVRSGAQLSMMLARLKQVLPFNITLDQLSTVMFLLLNHQK